MAEVLEFAPVSADRWPDLARLFERRGGPKYCWCMVWRELPSGRRGEPGAKRAALEDRVARGVPVGILAYADGEPVAWCSVAPRETYRELGGGDYPQDASAALAPPGRRAWTFGGRLTYLQPRSRKTRQQQPGGDRVGPELQRR